MADYCTSTEAKALATVESGLATSSDYDAVFDVLVTAASRAIDREVGRWDNYFSPSSDDGTYYYDGSGLPELWIDEFAAITSVSVSEAGGLATSDYTAWNASDYMTYPYNSTPILKLEVDSLNGSKLYFDRYKKAVKIVGKRGYSTTPPSTVNLAARIQTARWFVRGKQMWQENSAQTDLGQVVVNVGNRNFIGSKLDPDVAALLQPYKVANL